ncbi:unnamed protein product [Cuscuta epithymum]|uniref:protein-serine/threonine phosphatase n=1 Tax=Cuscuta epithymum TaxID=186058 RepID=A0AAV0F472_9ASTE|nr:unnamed protein product [Cuscuta epithymum]
MEEMSPAVAVTVRLSNTIVDSPTNHVEITRLKIVTDGSSCNGVKVDVNGRDSLVVGGGSSADNHSPSVLKLGKILSVQETNEINGEELTSDMRLPIAVEFEGIDNGEIVAKVISLEEQDISSSPTTIKASVVALPLSGEKDHGKGCGVKSVYELDCVPIWGCVSICGKSQEMEDATTAAPNFMRIPIKMFIGDHVMDGFSQTLSHLTSHFFGVYDGHGGSQVASYCQERIHLALAEELKFCKDDPISCDINVRDVRQLLWERVFKSCFLKVDDEVGGKVRPGDETSRLETSAPKCTSSIIAPETVGSTAVVAVISSSHIVVANCGDSRAVLYRGKEAMALSIDHKPNRKDEYTRIEASGGKVIQWNGHRVFGVLAMSRAIGDRYLKPWIIPEPEVMFIPRAREDECLVLASDGLWDVMTNEEACEAARKKILIWHKKNGSTPFQRGTGSDPAAQAAADYLSMLALQRGSRDNISVIVVDLKAQRKFKTKS